MRTPQGRRFEKVGALDGAWAYALRFQLRPNSKELFMDFEQLRIFLILAEEGTYLGAANRLATSRSRVRRKLDQLEREAATPLIIRDGGGPTPNACGRSSRYTRA
jgi:molybdenum-dependent DNA-binding transcriptional regulator ModE